MTEDLPTRGQLERRISQEIQAFYRYHLGHQPSKVTCQFFSEKLAIVIEDSVTSTEQILLDDGQHKLVEEVRFNLDNMIQPQLKKLVEEITKLQIVDILHDITLKTGCTGIIMIFTDSPRVKNPRSIPKLKRIK